jgi:DNA-binding LytR/AlgR family response regulator
MKLTCMITHDEPVARKGLASYVQRTPSLQLMGECEDTTQLTAALRQTRVDLLFLDIEMPFRSGIEWLQETPQSPKVIITTAYENYALQGFELDVLDYLLKPVSFERFSKAVSKAMDYFNATKQSHPEYIFIKADGRLEKIFFQQILFIQAAENYIIIQTASKKWMTHSTLKSFLEKLPSSFIQTHKSWVVNIPLVSAVQGNTVYCGTHAVPVSKYMREDVMRQIIDGQQLP